jgi:carbon monoxide dehydrogenase subunit G
MSARRDQGDLVPTYTAQLSSSASPDVAFAYLAQFDNTAHWDPGVSDAHAETDGPPALGSVYAVTVELGAGPEVLRYAITDYAPPNRVVLEAEGTKFRSRDELTVEPEGTGSLVSYEARRDLKGLMKVGAPFAGRALRTAGDAAVEGLARELARLAG